MSKSKENWNNSLVRNSQKPYLDYTFLQQHIMPSVNKLILSKQILDFSWEDFGKLIQEGWHFANNKNYASLINFTKYMRISHLETFKVPEVLVYCDIDSIIEYIFNTLIWICCMVECNNLNLRITVNTAVRQKETFSKTYSKRHKIEILSII